LKIQLDSVVYLRINAPQSIWYLGFLIVSIFSNYYRCCLRGIILRCSSFGRGANKVSSPPCSFIQFVSDDATHSYSGVFRYYSACLMPASVNNHSLFNVESAGRGLHVYSTINIGKAKVLVHRLVAICLYIAVPSDSLPLGLILDGNSVSAVGRWILKCLIYVLSVPTESESCTSYTQWRIK
jgi:hypothetical protein